MQPPRPPRPRWINAKIASALRQFRGLPQWLALVAEIDGVRYVNDSKATNVDSLKRALESFGDMPITLIAGGRDKNGDFVDSPARGREGPARGLRGRGRADPREGMAVTRPEARRPWKRPCAPLGRDGAGRRRAALAGVRLLRHVPELRGARRPLRGGRPSLQRDPARVKP